VVRRARLQSEAVAPAQIKQAQRKPPQPPGQPPEAQAPSRRTPHLLLQRVELLLVLLQLLLPPPRSGCVLDRVLPLGGPGGRRRHVARAVGLLLLAVELRRRRRFLLLLLVAALRGALAGRGAGGVAPERPAVVLPHLEPLQPPAVVCVGLGWCGGGEGRGGGRGCVRVRGLLCLTAFCVQRDTAATLLYAPRQRPQQQPNATPLCAQAQSPRSTHSSWKLSAPLTSSSLGTCSALGPFMLNPSYCACDRHAAGCWGLPHPRPPPPPNPPPPPPRR